MIRSLSASNQAFKTITFREGFNVILADRDPLATDQQSRNARGKTSLLLIINYMLGGNLAPSLRLLADDGWSFTLSIDLFGHDVSVTRNLSGGSRLGISYPSALRSALSGYVTEGAISLDDWKDLLGLALFRLEPEPDPLPDGLSVRSLLSYVVRSNPPSDPLKFFPTQPATSVRKHVAFLLGLDWTVVREMQLVNRQLDGVQAVLTATRDGVVDSLRPTDELELERSAAQNAVDAMRGRIGEFRVLEDPEHMVVRADELTARISELRDQAFIDQRMAGLYSTAIQPDQGEREVDDERVIAIFNAAGALFSETALRRLDQVGEFRANLLRNRTQFLEAELTAIRAKLTSISIELSELDSERERLMSSLRAGGALDELLALQAEFASLTSRVSVLDSQIAQARNIASTVDQLRLDKARIRNDATSKLTEDRSKIDGVSDRFREKMKQLYDVDAAISVSVDVDGYLFVVSVASGTSSAVSRMKLFCFDLTLLEEGAATGHHPDFLMHDSSVFDGVDPRQRASALQFANAIANSTGGQYICTLNSNDVPDDIENESWFTDGVIRTVLDTDMGGLFGVTF